MTKLDVGIPEIALASFIGTALIFSVIIFSVANANEAFQSSKASLKTSVKPIIHQHSDAKLSHSTIGKYENDDEMQVITLDYKMNQFETIKFNNIHHVNA